MVITEKQSNSFWAIKAFAIFTVFFAHMPGHSANAEVFDRIGLIGVPLFMLCAGFFYKKDPETGLGTFLNKKFKSLIIPWLVWGTIAYCIHILKGIDVGIVHYLKWILGIGTWLYFVPVLLCCQILSRYLNNFVLLFLGLISMFLSVYHLIPYNELFTPYVNPFNFVGFFAIGLLMRTYDKWMTLKPIGGGILLVVSVLLIWLLKPVYWYPYTLVISSVLLISLFSCFQAFDNSFASPVGKVSFVIYLSHIQVAGFVNQLSSRLWGTPFEFLKVVAAFAIVSLMVLVIKRLLTAMKLDSLLRYLGYR